MLMFRAICGACLEMNPKQVMLSDFNQVLYADTGCSTIHHKLQLQLSFQIALSVDSMSGSTPTVTNEKEILFFFPISKRLDNFTKRPFLVTEMIMQRSTVLTFKLQQMLCLSSNRQRLNMLFNQMEMQMCMITMNA